MIYLEGPEDPEYVMHMFYLKYSGWFCPTNNRKVPEIVGLSTIKKYVICRFVCKKYSQEYFR